MPLTFKNFLAASRKANLPFFGLFRPTDDTSWVENHWGAPAGQVPTGTPDGETVAFTLATTPPNGVMVFNNGVFQVPSVAYTLSGNTVTFLAGYIPKTGAALYAVVW